MKAIALVLLMACVGCVSVVASASYVSPDGNTYPSVCQRDLSHVQPAFLMTETRESLAEMRDHLFPGQGRLYGYTLFQKLIVIDETLTGWFREQVIHHEKCHIIMGRWHS